jgi:small subunit ribosomal protein S6
MYELMYVISPEKDDEGIDALIEKVNGTIESLDGAVDGVIHNEPWGRRRLAYPIDDYEDGYYVLSHFSLEQEKLGELERVLKLNDAILRYLLTRRHE